MLPQSGRRNWIHPSLQLLANEPSRQRPTMNWSMSGCGQSTQMAQQQLDPALGAFEKLKVRSVIGGWGDNAASTFLAKFQTTAASLEPDERIKLIYTHGGMGLLKDVLVDPQADKVCALFWEYSGEEDVHSIVPLLTDNCPELGTVKVTFKHHSEFDFVSSVLEHPRTKLKVLEMSPYKEGDLPRFFAALGQSQVSALTLFRNGSPVPYQGLYEYLAKDLLVRLKVIMDNRQVPLEMMVSLANCTRLARLELTACKFSQPTALTHLPKSVTKLALCGCTFVGRFDQSFLAGSSVRELDLIHLKGVGGKQLGGALVAHLREKGLDELRIGAGGFADETLAVVGVEMSRIKRLVTGSLNDASIAQIALTLQSPNNAMKELSLPYENGTTSSIENHLVPALRHPNCTLAELTLSVYQHEHEAAAKTVEEMFRNRIRMFALLQGQQVKRRYCPLRRLPVEMFRLVGMALL